MCICVTVISHKSAFCGTAISHKSLSIHAACGGMYRKGKRGFSGDTPAPPSRGRSPLHPRPTAKSGLGSLLCPVKGPQSLASPPGRAKSGLGSLLCPVEGPQSLASPPYGKERSPPLPMPRRGATVPCIPALRQRAVSGASRLPGIGLLLLAYPPLIQGLPLYGNKRVVGDLLASPLCGAAFSSIIYVVTRGGLTPSHQ